MMSLTYPHAQSAEWSVFVKATFAPDLLEVDEALWGGFWQGDVLSPGYLLPVAELNLLRVTRLDKTWPETTSLAQFLAEVETLKQNPQAMIIITWGAGTPCWGVIVPKANQHVIVWYSLTTQSIHAVYETSDLPLKGLDPETLSPSLPLAVRLDAAILRHWHLAQH